MSLEDIGMAAVRPINDVGRWKEIAQVTQIVCQVWFVAVKTAQKILASLIGLTAVNFSLMSLIQVIIYALFVKISNYFDHHFATIILKNLYDFFSLWLQNIFK